MILSPHIAVAPALRVSKTSTPPCYFLLRSLDTSEWWREQRVCGYSLLIGMCWLRHTQRWCYGEPFHFGEWRLWIWVPSSPIQWVGTEVQYIAPWRCPWTVVHSLHELDKIVIISYFSPSLFHVLFSEMTSLRKHHVSCPSSLPVLSRAAWAKKSYIYPARYGCHKLLCPS